jgi:hypothetical protein
MYGLVTALLHRNFIEDEDNNVADIFWINRVGHTGIVCLE